MIHLTRPNDEAAMESLLLCKNELCTFFLFQFLLVILLVYIYIYNVFFSYVLVRGADQNSVVSVQLHAAWHSNAAEGVGYKKGKR